MSELLIRQLFNNEVTSVKFTNKGLTNQNWLVESKDEFFMVRIPYHNSEHIVSRQHEKAAIDIVYRQSLDVETVYFNEKTGIKITKYVDDLLTFDEYTGKDKYYRVGRLMKKFHSLNVISGFLFDPIQRLNQYKAQIKNKIFIFEDEDKYIHFIYNQTDNFTLCHNDWVAGNIGFASTRDYLIDYEYAGDNHPYFDVTSFLSENQIFDEAARNDFYIAYFSKLPDQEIL
ncbi:MAG: choline/ethanolamine kinase family protein, partial [Erysipelotrichaceae bacterium]|nr:choline/ethanolamine kinase family protein [Erysipelotrichaceae bacterium]